MPVKVPADVVASEDIARLVMELNVCCAAPFKERPAELISDGGKDGGGACCVITDMELNVPSLGFMTSSAASFGSFIAYPRLIEKGYLPFRVRDLC